MSSCLILFCHGCRMEHTPLKEITPHSHQWTVRVRAVRFSECKNKEQPPRVVRIDFILIDEQVLYFYVS
jgi:hypothetical protein